MKSCVAYLTKNLKYFAWLSRCRYWDADSCRSKEPCNRWSPDPSLEGALLRGNIYIVTYLKHECIAPCSSAAVGECACLANVADERICCREKTAMRSFAKSLWTVVVVKSYNCNC